MIVVYSAVKRFKAAGAGRTPRFLRVATGNKQTTPGVQLNGSRGILSWLRFPCIWPNPPEAEVHLEYSRICPACVRDSHACRRPMFGARPTKTYSDARDTRPGAFRGMQPRRQDFGIRWLRQSRFALADAHRASSERSLKATRTSFAQWPIAQMASPWRNREVVHDG